MMSTMAVMLAPGFCRGFYRIAGPRAIGASAWKTQGS
jgi:hypothetical protein